MGGLLSFYLSIQLMNSLLQPATPGRTATSELAGALSGQRPLSWLALTPGPLVNQEV